MDKLDAELRKYKTINKLLNMGFRKIKLREVKLSYGPERFKNREIRINIDCDNAIVEYVDSIAVKIKIFIFKSIKESYILEILDKAKLHKLSNNIPKIRTINNSVLYFNSSISVRFNNIHKLLKLKGSQLKRDIPNPRRRVVNDILENYYNWYLVSRQQEQIKIIETFSKTINNRNKLFVIFRTEEGIYLRVDDEKFDRVLFSVYKRSTNDAVEIALRYFTKDLFECKMVSVLKQDRVDLLGELRKFEESINYLEKDEVITSLLRKVREAKSIITEAGFCKTNFVQSYIFNRCKTIREANNLVGALIDKYN